MALKISKKTIEDIEQLPNCNIVKKGVIDGRTYALFDKTIEHSTLWRIGHVILGCLSFLTVIPAFIYWSELGSWFSGREVKQKLAPENAINEEERNTIAITQEIFNKAIETQQALSASILNNTFAEEELDPAEIQCLLSNSSSEERIALLKHMRPFFNQELLADWISTFVTSSDLNNDDVLELIAIHAEYLSNSLSGVCAEKLREKPQNFRLELLKKVPVSYHMNMNMNNIFNALLLEKEQDPCDIILDDELFRLLKQLKKYGYELGSLEKEMDRYYAQTFLNLLGTINEDLIGTDEEYAIFRDTIFKDAYTSFIKSISGNSLSASEKLRLMSMPFVQLNNFLNQYNTQDALREFLSKENLNNSEILKFAIFHVLIPNHPRIEQDIKETIVQKIQQQPLEMRKQQLQECLESSPKGAEKVQILKAFIAKKESPIELLNDSIFLWAKAGYNRFTKEALFPYLVDYAENKKTEFLSDLEQINDVTEKVEFLRTFTERNIFLPELLNDDFLQHPAMPPLNAEVYGILAPVSQCAADQELKAFMEAILSNNAEESIFNDYPKEKLENFLNNCLIMDKNSLSSKEKLQLMISPFTIKNDLGNPYTIAGIVKEKHLDDPQVFNCVLYDLFETYLSKTKKTWVKSKIDKLDLNERFDLLKNYAKEKPESYCSEKLEMLKLLIGENTPSEDFLPYFDDNLFLWAKKITSYNKTQIHAFLIPYESLKKEEFLKAVEEAENTEAKQQVVEDFLTTGIFLDEPPLEILNDEIFQFPFTKTIYFLLNETLINRDERNKAINREYKDFMNAILTDSTNQGLLTEYEEEEVRERFDNCMKSKNLSIEKKLALAKSNYAKEKGWSNHLELQKSLNNNLAPLENLEDLKFAALHILLNPTTKNYYDTKKLRDHIQNSIADVDFDERFKLLQECAVQYPSNAKGAFDFLLKEEDPLAENLTPELFLWLKQGDYGYSRRKEDVYQAIESYAKAKIEAFNPLIENSHDVEQKVALLKAFLEEGVFLAKTLPEAINKCFEGEDTPIIDEELYTILSNLPANELRALRSLKNSIKKALAPYQKTWISFQNNNAQILTLQELVEYEELEKYSVEEIAENLNTQWKIQEDQGDAKDPYWLREDYEAIIGIIAKKYPSSLFELLEDSLKQELHLKLFKQHPEIVGTYPKHVPLSYDDFAQAVASDVKRRKKEMGDISIEDLLLESINTYVEESVRHRPEFINALVLQYSEAWTLVTQNYLGLEPEQIDQILLNLSQGLYWYEDKGLSEKVKTIKNDLPLKNKEANLQDLDTLLGDTITNAQRRKGFEELLRNDKDLEKTEQLFWGFIQKDPLGANTYFFWVFYLKNPKEFCLNIIKKMPEIAYYLTGEHQREYLPFAIEAIEEPLLGDEE